MNPEQPRKICPACRTVNRPDCRFCTGCGIAFPQERICTHCNAPLSGSEKFCQTCGVPSDEAVSRNFHRNQKKFCHQCRALINHDAKFCNMCGTVISQLPVCPRCGDPIGPDEKFCGVCGLPFGTTTPVRQEPAKTVQPAPPQSHYQPEIPPASAKKGGIPFGKIVIGVIILLVVLAGIIMILPDSPPPPPPAGGGTVTAGIQVRTGEDPAATQVAVDASNAVVKGVAEALAAGDSAGFASHLVAEDREVLEGADFDPARGAGLAGAFRDAKIVAAYPGIVHYEMSVGSTLYTFYTINEEGTWKIAGL